MGTEWLTVLGGWVSVTLVALILGVIWRVIIPRSVTDVIVAALTGVTLGIIVIFPTQAGRDWGWVIGGVLLPWGGLCGWIAATFVSKRRNR